VVRIRVCSSAVKPSKTIAGFSRCRHAITVSIAVTALIALLTPPLYTTWRPTWLPWPLESYIDGCHNLGAPQPWLFPSIPVGRIRVRGLGCGIHPLQRPGAQPGSNNSSSICQAWEL
jgi:hypothetical protein